MARKKISTTVYLTEVQVAALKELHNRTRVPIAEYIRLGIDLILERNSHRLPGQVSLFDNLSDEELGVGKKDDRKPNAHEEDPGLQD
jgi:hypothetical protein